MEKHINFIALVMGLSMLLIGNTVLAVPGIPHQFFGEVMVNGAPSPDGTTVSAKIGSATVSSTTTSGGLYGYSPKIFYVEDPDANRAGSIIEFFVNGVDAGAAAYFANGKSEQLDLSVTIASQNTGNNAGSLGSSGGGGGSSSSIINTAVNNSAGLTTANSANTKVKPTGPCTEQWNCGEWSACDAGIQKRSCVDANKCGTVEDIPLLSQPCGEEVVVESLNTESSAFGGLAGITGRMVSFASGSTAYVIGAAVLIGLSAYFFKSKSAAKKKTTWK